MNLRSIKVLEFDKILSRLSEHAVMESTKEEIISLKPSSKLKQVKKMLDETGEALTICVKCGSPSIYVSKDIRGSLKRVMIGGVLTCEELINISKTLSTSRGFKKYLDEEYTDVLKEHFECLYEDKKLETKINLCIIDAETVADDASSNLLDIRRKIKNANNKVKDILQKMISSATYQKALQENIITMRSDRYVIPVKAEYKGSVQGIVHDVSSTGATVFIEPISVVETNNEIRKLLVEEKEEIEKILAMLSNEVALVAKLVEMTYETIVMLDMVFSKAKFALKTNAFKPLINDKGIINLIKARHPFIDERKVVATDIYLGKDFDTLVVTGPNTGGKTVTLKTIGLLTLMAQSGLFITANEGSEISVFEEVFADIGDEQSIEQSLSTFSSHMVNIVDILENVNDATLCLFDELGAGTDPIEGAALAISILEYIKNVGAKSCATTHYSELKMYALSNDRVENASCEFDVETLAPTYRLLIGIPGKSNAFAISKRLGLSDYIIEKAKEHIDSENVKMEDVLSELERNRLKAEKDKNKAKSFKKEAQSLKDEMAKRNKALSDKTDKIISRAKDEAERILDEAKKEADKLISDMKKAQKLRDAHEANRAMENARRKFNEKKKSLDKEEKQEVKAKGTPPKTVKKGDSVNVLSVSQPGTVITLPDSKGDLIVKVGIMKINTNLSDLRLTKEETPKKEKSRISSHVSKTMDIGTELDVRGENVEDAIYLLEKFLDDAILSSLSVVRVIHGKGTGMLRNGLHAYLKKQPRVKTFRLGTFGEGDAGVTVIELK